MPVRLLTPPNPPMFAIPNEARAGLAALAFIPASSYAILVSTGTSAQHDKTYKAQRDCLVVYERESRVV